MQLKPKDQPSKKATVRRQLMIASCALLGTGAARSQESAGPSPQSGFLDNWSIDSALAYYHENGRIQAIEPVVDVAKVFAYGQAINLNYTFDALSGSSPNGALPSHLAQTFASPSGTRFAGPKTYLTAPGRLPVDPNYHDDRFAISANWTMPLTRGDQLSVGAKVSDEHDFVSVTVNVGVSHDFNDKNTAVSLGVYNEYDRLSPIGGTPIAGSSYALFEKTGNKTKDGVGALVGVTQVVTDNWLSEFNISVDRFKGYLNDPYKITSIIDGAGNTVGYEYESRPWQRTRKSAYWGNRAAWNSQASTALSLRYFRDNWGVSSETAELRPRWSFSNRERYVEPTVRWYRQTAANFYTPWLMPGSRPSDGCEASDSRLGAFHALTYGVKFAQKFAGKGDHEGSEFSIRVEYYQQTFNERIATPVELQGLDLFPGLKAMLLQFGYRF
jgi:hypothetical protein